MSISSLILARPVFRHRRRRDAWRRGPATSRHSHLSILNLVAAPNTFTAKRGRRCRRFSGFPFVFVLRNCRHLLDRKMTLLLLNILGIFFGPRRLELRSPTKPQNAAAAAEDSWKVFRRPRPPALQPLLKPQKAAATAEDLQIPAPRHSARKIGRWSLRSESVRGGVGPYHIDDLCPS